MTKANSLFHPSQSTECFQVTLRIVLSELRLAQHQRCLTHGGLCVNASALRRHSYLISPCQRRLCQIKQYLISTRADPIVVSAVGGRLRLFPGTSDLFDTALYLPIGSLPSPLKPALEILQKGVETATSVTPLGKAPLPLEINFVAFEFASCFLLESFC